MQGSPARLIVHTLSTVSSPLPFLAPQAKAMETVAQVHWTQQMLQLLPSQKYLVSLDHHLLYSFYKVKAA